MADVKENAMLGGIPSRLRGLDVNGNSTTPTIEEVVAGFPVATPNFKGLMRSDQSRLVDTSNFSFGISGGNSTTYFRLGRFDIGHYSPVRLCVSYGTWNTTSRTVIDITITNGDGNIVISGVGYSLVGYVLGSWYIDIYFICHSGTSLVGSIYGNLLDGRTSTIDKPDGIVFAP